MAIEIKKPIVTPAPLKKYIQTVNSLGNYYNKIYKNLNIGQLDKYNSQIQPILKQVQHLDECLIETIKITTQVYETLKKRDEEYPALLDVSQELAKRGWLISYYFTLKKVDKMAFLASEGSIDELEKLIENYYNADIEKQIDIIIEKYPEKKFLLIPARDAHLREEYSLSILAFFAIADGICSENAGKELFHGTEKNRITTLAKSELEKLENQKTFYRFNSNLALEAAMWASVKEKLPVAYGQKEREENNYDGLNRNVFHHGLATEDQATKQNSLKAFSLLSFIVSLLKRQDEDQEFLSFN